MKYMWSKNRIAKYLLPIILKDRKPNQWYVEPFVWGANMIDKVEGNRIWSDFNEYLIEFLKWMQEDKEKTPYISKEKFEEIKNNISNFPKWLVWLSAFQLSFGSMWFWSYRRDNQWKRDYAEETIRNIEKQKPKIKWIDFKFCSYKNLEIPKESIIYCDIPYKWTAKYKWVEEFNYEDFYNWCREKKKEGHTIFISEYNMPDDFKCVWQQELTNNLNNKKATEKLFTL